ncbi:hypothetical protein BHM04_08130 [Macrococcus sp. IME1552]|nr:homocysteine S-methyltransferase family protein [Macrococcus sp. IME1552]ATD31158.1 hypothetical protein BHM04_08130 [Macrococcus sp. IME1552]
MMHNKVAYFLNLTIHTIRKVVQLSIDDSDASLIEAAVKWKDKGVKIIGGCCQVGLGEIGTLVEVMK